MPRPRSFDVQLGGYGGQPGASLWWTDRAPDRDAAIAAAQSDLRTIWTALSSLRGTREPMERGLMVAFSSEETSSTLPIIRIHPAVTGGVPISAYRTPITGEEVGKATLALFRAWLADAMPDCTDRAAAIYARARTDDRITRLNCCHLDGRGQVSPPPRFREALLAAAVASDQLEPSHASRRHDIDIPQSATARTILRNALKATQADDLATAASLMRRLGLGLLAQRLEAREEAP